MSKFEERKGLIQRMYDETNKGNIEILHEMLADDFVSYGGAGFQDLHGPEAFIDLFGRFSRIPRFEVRRSADCRQRRRYGRRCAAFKPDALGNFLGMVPATGKKSRGRERQFSGSTRTAKSASAGKTSIT